jgi:peptidoglycan hydrolase CwlO-like protein
MDIKTIDKQIESLLRSIVVKTEKIDLLKEEIKTNRKELKRLEDIKQNFNKI